MMSVGDSLTKTVWSWPKRNSVFSLSGLFCIAVTRDHVHDDLKVMRSLALHPRSHLALPCVRWCAQITACSGDATSHAAAKIGHSHRAACHRRRENQAPAEADALKSHT